MYQINSPLLKPSWINFWKLLKKIAIVLKYFFSICGVELRFLSDLFVKKRNVFECFGKPMINFEHRYAKYKF